MNRREFLKKGLEGIVVAIPLISVCLKSPLESELGRIIPFESIDGVNLGDTMNTVEKKLGTHDGEFRWDGIYGGGKGYEYNEGFYAGLEVCFMGDDYVEGLFVREPYSGRTKEGIGIGSYFALLHDVYGMPNESSPNHEIYYYNDRLFYIHYENSFIKLVQINFRHKF